MSEFKKGQLVAVRDFDHDKCVLCVYCRSGRLGHMCKYIGDDLDLAAPGGKWWRDCRPAEEVWPELFLGQHNRAYTKAIDKLNAKIEWLCSNLAGALNEGNLCPPNARCDGRVECEDCWSFAAEIATEETCPQ